VRVNVVNLFFATCIRKLLFVFTFFFDVISYMILLSGDDAHTVKNTKMRRGRII